MSIYTPTGLPEENTRGISQQLRTEFQLIRDAINTVNLAGTEAQGATENDYVVTTTYAVTSYPANSIIAFIATHANTSAATLKIGSLAAKTLKDADGNPLAAGDITTGSLVLAFYNGTDFFLASGNDRVARSGDTYTGTHDLTSAILQVASHSQGNNSANAANTAYVDTGLALKANIESPEFTGVPKAPTATVGSSGNQLATLDFVSATSFSLILPGQAGNAGQVLKTDGTNAFWGQDAIHQVNRITGVI